MQCTPHREAVTRAVHAPNTGVPRFHEGQFYSNQYKQLHTLSLLLCGRELRCISLCRCCFAVQHCFICCWFVVQTCRVGPCRSVVVVTEVVLSSASCTGLGITLLPVGFWFGQ